MLTHPARAQGAPVTATYFVSKAAPYVLRKTLVKSAAVTMEQASP